ncbi:MAG TPA: hypothetical protein VF235_07175 [Actinomycetota bacterium]
MNRRAAVLGLVLLASIGLGVALRAAGTVTPDPNDTPGLFDVETVRFVREPGEFPRWSVRMYGVWTIAEVWDRGYASVEFDTRYGEDADFYVLVRSLGNRLDATLFRVRPHAQNDLAVAKVKVRRGSPDGLSVWVPLRKLDFGASRTTFGWWVLTTFTGDRCPASCFDRVPDDGAVQLPVPGVSPSPSPTTSSSSTPPPTSFAPPLGD